MDEPAIVRPDRRPPHAPFRAGAPRFVPALAPIDPSGWLVPDTEAHVLAWKNALLAAPDRVLRQDPDAASAVEETVALVSAHLGAEAEDLVAASRLVSDDVVVMMRTDAGAWRTGALTLTAPTFFTIDAAFRHDLDALHGPVPDGARLAGRIARVFDHLRPDQVLERFNWTLQYGADRHTPSAAPLRARATRAPVQAAAAELHLRVERQTIRKLPATGAVVFTIRVCLDPLSALAVEDRPALAAAWRTLGPQGRAYKGWTALDPLTDALFNRWNV